MERIGWILAVLAMGTLVHGAEEAVQARASYNYTWTLTQSKDGRVVAAVTTSGQPTLKFDLCDLFGRDWPYPDTNVRTLMSPAGVKMGFKKPLPVLTPYGCGTKERERSLAATQYYVCPRTEDWSRCGGSGFFYCDSWSCVSEASWKHASKDIYLRRGTADNRCDVGACNPMILTVKDESWQSPEWDRGKHWGLRLYVTGLDPGVLFTFQRRRAIPPCVKDHP